MNCLYNTSRRLQPRNEGKIKSYDSCCDVRAWSHDPQVKDHYLREWMKRDMPVSFTPVCTLAGCLNYMNWRNRCRVIPRCHRSCRSKILIDSICTSCQAMRECLKKDDLFQKYFVEEEFDTSHWPCERCLIALKSIKMFWKVMVEKVFNITIPKCQEQKGCENPCCSRTDSIQQVAKIWQQDMVHQALLVKSLTPQLSYRPNRRSCESHTFPDCACDRPIKKERSASNISVCACERSSRKGVPGSNYNCSCDRPNKRDKTGSTTSNSTKLRFADECGSALTQKSNISTKSSMKTCTIATPTVRGSIGDSKKRSIEPKRYCKCTSVRVRTMDMGCDSCNYNDEEINSYKINVDFLQRNLDQQKSEIDKLKRENTSLKVEMRNLNRTNTWKSPIYCPTVMCDDEIVALVPKPFEEFCGDDEKGENTKDIDSEMIITMKKCHNESFKHVALLQVLHKTNNPMLNEVSSESGPKNCQKENPLRLLAKVQNTLGAIVKREMTIASTDCNRCDRNSNIQASFQRVNCSKSAPSCSTLSSCGRM